MLNWKVVTGLLGFLIGPALRISLIDIMKKGAKVWSCFSLKGKLKLIIFVIILAVLVALADTSLPTMPGRLFYGYGEGFLKANLSGGH